MFDLVVRGGIIVSAGGQRRADLGVADGLIKAVAPPGEQITGRQEVNAGSKVILPGLVDAHVHIPGYLLSRRFDDFRSATSAAAAGGVTTVMLMPTDDPRTATPDYFKRKRSVGEEQSFVDFAIQALIGPRSEHAEVAGMAAEGAISFELFLAYGGNPGFIVGHDDFELQRLLQQVREVGGTAGITPHSPSLIGKLTALQRELEAEQQVPYSGMNDGQPPPVARFSGRRPALSAAPA